MPLYWARFESDDCGRLFRLDTRIYLSDVPTCSPSDPLLGAVVAKNPGSAQPSRSTRSLQPVQLVNDRLLPTVRSIVIKAYRAADVGWDRGGYIQVLNLFSLCDNNFRHALREMALINHPPPDPAETRSFPWVFYLWGEHARCKASYIERLLDLKADGHFYFDKRRNVVVSAVPGSMSYAKHTQGLVHKPVITHLAQLLSLQNGRKASGTGQVGIAKA